MAERTLSFSGAIQEALADEMRRDPTVILLGEDVAGGKGRGKEGQSADAWGGAFGKTRGLVGEFGEARVRDTPISETAFLGAAIGAAMSGLRPVVDIMFSDFLGVCFDQVLNQAAKLRYMSGAALQIPLTVSTSSGGGVGAAAQHSGTLYALVAHIPGLKVVAPATPADAKGLLASAIRDNDPVFVFEHKRLYGSSGVVPEGEHLVPLGEANVVRHGDDLTLIGVSGTVQLVVDAAEELGAGGVECEVIDLRSIVPLDLATLLASAQKTGRVVIVDEAPPRCGLAADIAATINSQSFDRLQSPVEMVTAKPFPVPFSPDLEREVLPSLDDVLAAARRLLARDARVAS